jgi:hypothetical protein
MLERAYNQRDSTYWLLGLYIESDLQIINGVHRRKKPWRPVSMMLQWRVERALVRIYGSAPEVAER